MLTVELGFLLGVGLNGMAGAVSMVLIVMVIVNQHFRGATDRLEQSLVIMIAMGFILRTDQKSDQRAGVLIIPAADIKGETWKQS